mgnify:CR=1 FL=1
MNSNVAIQTIVFDLGGVLVDWNPKYVYKDDFQQTDEMNWFLAEVCNDKWNVTQDAGRTYAEGEAIKISEYPEYEEQIKLFNKNWHLMFSGPIAENVALFKQLRTNNLYKLYALTNWSAEKWPQALKLFPFFNQFDGAVVSGQEKTIKPFPDIYHILLNRYGLTAETTLFIDDKMENIEMATAIGFQTIHFTGEQSLKQQLRKFSIRF